jgi:23S rRNA maturation mini-RNase III
MKRKNALHEGLYDNTSIEEQRTLLEELETSLREAREDFKKSGRNLKACEAAKEWFLQESGLEEE